MSASANFEKMLYDQALMMMVFSECEGLLFKQTVEEIATYVRRVLCAPDGLFYAAEDADTEGKEGAFYLLQDDVIRFESVADLTAWMPQREQLFLERELREKPSKIRWFVFYGMMLVVCFVCLWIRYFWIKLMSMMGPVLVPTQWRFLCLFSLLL